MTGNNIRISRILSVYH